MQARNQEPEQPQVPNQRRSQARDQDEDTLLIKYDKRYGLDENQPYPRAATKQDGSIVANRAIGASNPDKNLTRYDSANAFIKENPRKLAVINDVASTVMKGLRQNKDVMCDDSEVYQLLEDLKYLKEENAMLRERINRITVDDESDLSNLEGFESVIDNLKKTIKNLQDRLNDSNKISLMYRNYISNCINGAYHQVMLDNVCKQVIDSLTAQADLISTLQIFFENARKLHYFSYIVKDAKDNGIIKMNEESEENVTNFNFDAEYKKIDYMFDNGSFTSENGQ